MIYHGIYAFIFYFLVMGMAAVGGFMGSVLFGLIGGLVFLFLFRKDILNLPNQKIAIFAGYLIFQFIFSSPFYFSLASLLIFLYILLVIIHAALTIGLFSLFLGRGSIKSDYCNFILSFFLSSVILSIVIVPVFIFYFTGGLYGAVPTALI